MRPPDLAKARQQRRVFRDELMQKVLAKADSHPLVYALAGLYTGKDLPGANQRLLAFCEKAVGPDKQMTATSASTEEIKWAMRTLVRTYYLFNSKNASFPGRLDAATQSKLEELFYYYGCGKSTLARASLENIWHIQGSENHDMMDLSNAYLALQAVADLEAYKDRKLPDGHTPAEHVKAWDAYYARYALERAKNGLFVEISPTYGKWFVGELFNLYDFSRSPLVRHRMEMLLHLTWADWSVDQLNGVRGGGKTRCYQGNYSERASFDSWDNMTRSLFGVEGTFSTDAGVQSNMIISLSGYEPPDVVMDLALARDRTQSFVYQSVRPAKLVGEAKEFSDKGVYRFDATGGRALRYSYCTPDYIMGSWMLDTRVNYAAINSQNRWQGVIFGADRGLRVFPQSIGLRNGKTYNQHQSVQVRNVTLVAADPRGTQTGHMTVFFSGDLRKTLVENDGWVIVKAGNAWLGVRVLSSAQRAGNSNYLIKEGSEIHEIETKYGFWLWPKEEQPPIVFVGSTAAKHPKLEDFKAYLASHRYTVNHDRVTYTCKDDTGTEQRLELAGDLPVPLINGKPVNLQPEKVFDSPYLSSVHGSGIVTIQKGDRKLVLDFNTTSDKEH